ncbi:MAG: RAMP superfamily CRISPR-associated protein [Rhizobiaceae bacterium]
MFADRTCYKFDLITAAATHVGTGAFRELSRPGRNEPMQIAAIARDNEGRPWLPPTTLKGVLRRLAEDTGLAGDNGFLPLFGAIKDSRNPNAEGNMGLLLMRAGRATGKSPDWSMMPYASLIETGDAFVAARTAIDGAIGVADDHKLFFQEMLPAGAKFTAEAIVLRHGSGSAAAIDLMDRLMAIAMRDGLRVGKGQADGQGALTIANVEVVDWTLTAAGDLDAAPQRTLTSAPSSVAMPANVVDARKWRLSCEAPFLVADSSVAMARDSHDPHREKKASGPQIRAQRVSENLPLVLGSSISGALRARATWLADRAVRRGELAGKEDAVQKLFGAIEWRALAEIRNLRVAHAEPFDITSLRIDRFSGGPVDNALFTTSAFVGVSASFDFVLVKRGGQPDGEARKLFSLLCEDIVANGLMLGAGASKGFGWFKVVEAGDGA